MLGIFRKRASRVILTLVFWYTVSEDFFVLLIDPIEVSIDTDAFEELIIEKSHNLIGYSKYFHTMVL